MTDIFEAASELNNVKQREIIKHTAAGLLTYLQRFCVLMRQESSEAEERNLRNVSFKILPG